MTNVGGMTWPLKVNVNRSFVPLSFHLNVSENSPKICDLNSTSNYNLSSTPRFFSLTLKLNIFEKGVLLSNN
jgi:hypothetical protein